MADYLSDPSKRAWIDKTEKIMRKYAEILGNAWVQRNETAVSFFYDDCITLFEADDDIEARITNMKMEIEEGPLREFSSKSKRKSGPEVVIEQYGKQILVRQHHRKKRAVVEKCLNDVLAKVHTHEQGNPDFILCYGNFREDEDLFIRFEELNYKVNEMRALKMMEPTMHAEDEHPDLESKFQAQHQKRCSPFSYHEKKRHSRVTDPKDLIPDEEKDSRNLDNDLHPKSLGVLSSPQSQSVVPPSGLKKYKEESWEIQKLSSPKCYDSPYNGPKIAELVWSTQTEVWTVCSHRRPSQARYYFVDSRKEDLFKFLVQLDKDPTEDIMVE